jgi:hypothetical protein
MFNVKNIEGIIVEHERGVKNRETHIWALLTFVLWEDRYMRRGQA